jgi:hypothetical protein
MIRIASPAPLADLLALFEEDPIAASLPKFAPNRRAIAIAHVAAGRSWLAFDEGLRPLCAAGLVPAGRGALEAWFVASPRAGPRLLAFLRRAQLTFRAIAQDGPVAIRATVAPGWRPGQRVARALGMSNVGLSAGMERWERMLCPTSSAP